MLSRIYKIFFKYKIFIQNIKFLKICYDPNNEYLMMYNIYSNLYAFDLKELIGINFRVDIVNIELRESFFMMCNIVYSNLIIFLFTLLCISHYNLNTVPFTVIIFPANVFNFFPMEYPMEFL